MTDRPIIFSAPMVRALLDGRKTQTRRLVRDMPEPPAHDSVVHPNPRHEAPYFDAYCGKPKTQTNPRGMSDYWCWWTRDDREGRGTRIRYAPGDRLYVRESWRVSPDACEGWHPDEKRGWIDYQAGGSLEVVAPSFDAVEAATFLKTEDHDWDFIPSRYRPSIHMPRWASRLTLIVEGVKVERLQEISDDDAIAEGIDSWSSECFGDDGFLSAAVGFRKLWESLHGAGSWDANPFVVGLTFRVERGNIDQLARAA